MPLQVDAFNDCMALTIEGSTITLNNKAWCKPMISLLDIAYKKLPLNTFFVNVQDAPLASHVCNLLFMKELMSGNKFRFLLHLNHEQPWEMGESRTCNDKDLINAYDKIDLVVRNYYYEEFDSHSLYLPLGPGNFISE